MVIEMQTGQPLFPGSSDIDQLWLIVKSFTEEQLYEMRDSPIFQVQGRDLNGKLIIQYHASKASPPSVETLVQSKPV